MEIPWDGTGINCYGMEQINMSHGQHNLANLCRQKRDGLQDQPLYIFLYFWALFQKKTRKKMKTDCFWWFVANDVGPGQKLMFSCRKCSRCTWQVDKDRHCFSIKSVFNLHVQCTLSELSASEQSNPMSCNLGLFFRPCSGHRPNF